MTLRETARQLDSLRENSEVKHMDDFEIQVIARDSFTDDEINLGIPYLTDTWIIQLGRAAFDTWREAWIRHITERKKLLLDFKRTVADMLGIDADAREIHVKQVSPKIFVVTYMRPLFRFRVEWDDHEGNRQTETFSYLDDAEREAANLRETFDYVRVISI